MDGLALVTLYAVTVVAHEAIHYIVARAAGLTGLRLVFDAGRGSIGIRFESGSLTAIRVSAAAPQLLTLVLMAVWLYTGSLEALAAAMLNVIGSISDFAIIVSPPAPGVESGVQRKTVEPAITTRVHG